MTVVPCPITSLERGIDALKKQLDELIKSRGNTEKMKKEAEKKIKQYNTDIKNVRAGIELREKTAPDKKFPHLGELSRVGQDAATFIE